MKKSKILALSVATALCAVGMVIAFFAMVDIGFDFRRLDTCKAVTNTHTVEGDFAKITAEMDISDLRFALSEDGSCRAVYCETDKIVHSATIEGDALVIRESDQRAWYDYIGVHTIDTSVTVYLPKTAYDSLKINGDTCDVTVPGGLTFGEAAIEVHTGDVSFGAEVLRTLSVKATTGDVTVADVTVGGDLNVKTDTGDVTLKAVTVAAVFFETDTGEVDFENVSCASISGKSDTGDVTLENVIVTGHLRLESDTGHVELKRCDAATLFIQIDTGDVKGVLLSDKVFVVEADTGDVEIPHGTTGGLCEIHTHTGDIEIRIEK